MGVSRSDDKVLRSRAGALKASLTPSNKPIFKAEDEIIDKRDALINSLEKRLAQRTSSNTLFTIRWSVE